MALTLAEANQIVQGALDKAKEMNIRISVAVCDAGGRLVAFSRMVGNQEGQVFAIVVMVVAACEVVVGLGLIVAIFRRKLPLNVDDLRELRG